MNVLQRKVQIFIFLLFVGVLVGAFAIYSYPWFHSLFPTYTEVEIQLYYIASGVVLGAFSIIFWLHKKIPFLKIHFPLSLSVILFMMAILGISFFIIVFPSILQDTNFTRLVYYAGVVVIRDIQTWHIFLGTCLLFLFLLPVFCHQEIRQLLKKSSLYRKLMRTLPILHRRYVFMIASVLLVTVLSFHIPSISSIDYAYYVGPINDVLFGKHLLVDVPSQYGFISIAFLSILFRLIDFGLLPMMIVNAVIVTLGYIGVYLLLQSLIKNNYLAIFAAVVTIFSTYIVQTAERGWFPQTSFLRFGFWIIFALLLMIFNQSNKKRLKNMMAYIFPFIVSVSIFWSFDSGIYMVLAYISFVLFQSLHSTPRVFFLNSTIKIFEFILIFLGILFGISGYYVLRYGIWIHWENIFLRSQYYLQGFGLIQLEHTTWPWIIIGGYLLTLSYLFMRKMMMRRNKLSSNEEILSFILFYGIFQFAYYMGRSALNNLHHVSVPFFICIFFLLGKISFWFEEHHLKLHIRVLCVFVTALLMGIPLTLISIQGFKNLTAHNIVNSIKIATQYRSIESQYYGSVGWAQTAQKLEQGYGLYIKEHGITLLSAHDTWYLVIFKRPNNITSNNLQYYIESQELYALADQILQIKDQYIFIDHQRDLDRGQVATVFSKISGFYRFIQNLGNLDVYERI